MMNVWRPIDDFAPTEEANTQEIHQGTGTSWRVRTFLDHSINWWKMLPTGILPTQPDENSVVHIYQFPGIWM